VGLGRREHVLGMYLVILRKLKSHPSRPGHKSERDSYRSISLISVGSKLLSIMLSNSLLTENYDDIHYLSSRVSDKVVLIMYFCFDLTLFLIVPIFYIS
jgi:hypothetical protein